MDEPESPPTLFPNQGPEAITIRFRFGGLVADRGEMSTDSLLATARGWDDLLHIFEQLVVHGVPVSTRHMKHRRRSTLIQAPQRGSFEFGVLWFVAGWAASRYLSKAADRVEPWLLKKLFEFVSQYFEAKQDSTSMREFTQRWHAFLREASMNMIDEEVDLYDSVVALEEAMHEFTLPLDKDAEQVKVTSPSTPESLELGHDQRKIVLAPLATDADEPLDDERLVMARFVRLNNKTGRGLAEFAELGHKQFGSSQFCVIQDEVMATPRNPYTEALSSRDALKVWACQMKPMDGRLNIYWRISGCEDPPQQLLFQKDGRPKAS